MSKFIVKTYTIETKNHQMQSTEASSGSQMTGTKVFGDSKSKTSEAKASEVEQTACHKNSIPKHEPPSNRLRFVFVTDLHNTTYGPANQKLIQAIEKLHPDAVLLGGDLVLGKPGRTLQTALDFIREISVRFPSFYANGNHEQRLRLYPETYGDMHHNFLKQLSNTQVHHLVNASEVINLHGIPVRIYGFEPKKKYYRRLQGRKLQMPETELTKTFGSPDPKCYNILLSHNPSYTQTYLDWGADLTLCGHFHGGVIRLGKHRGVINPNLQLFSKYCYGEYEREDHHVIISSGLGEHSVPFRIFNPYELVSVDVYGKDQA